MKTEAIHREPSQDWIEPFHSGIDPQSQPR
jgi:hypothetical protein